MSSAFALLGSHGSEPAQGSLERQGHQQDAYSIDSEGLSDLTLYVYPGSTEAIDQSILSLKRGRMRRPPVRLCA